MSERNPDLEPLTAVVSPANKSERRQHRRAKISRSVRVRPSYSDDKLLDEVQTTLNASRSGLYFTTTMEHYYVGMKVRVMFPYNPNDSMNSEYFAEVVRLDRLAGGRTGVAVHFVLR